MSMMKIKDIAIEKNERIENPSQSPYSVFVGLEHYDSGEATIQRFGSTERLESSMKVFHSGDVLVARRNVYLKRAAAVDFEGLTSGDSIVLHVEDIAYRRLLPFVLNTDAFWDYANQHADGSMSKRLSPKLLLEYEFYMPDDNIEQITNTLWAMERAKRAYRNLIAKTDDLVKSQFIEMFGSETNLIKLEDICVHFGDGDWIESKDQSEEGIRLIQTGNIGDGEYKDKGDKARYISEETFDRLNCTEVVPGDVLVSRLPDPIGRACIIPDMPKSITAVDCTIIRLNDRVFPEFFVNYTKTPAYRNQIDSVTTGSTRKRVSRANLGKVLVPVPSLDKQKEFVEFSKQSDKSKFAAQQALKDLTATQKALMKKIFEQ